jgi:phosphoribosylformylglycinamidine cyclo-ligase
MYRTDKPYTGKVLDMIRKTWNSPYLHISEGIYPVQRMDPAFVTRFVIDHTDGIGSKGYFLWERFDCNTAALDALAMNVNDLLMARARPFKMQCHITIPDDNEWAIYNIIEPLVDYCIKHHIAFTGGETSIVNVAQAVDVSITMSGFAGGQHHAGAGDPNRFSDGDTLIGLPSSGFHSNGFTKLRELGVLEGGPMMGMHLAPTALYWDDVWPFVDVANGMMHITGGAYSKFKPYLHGVDLQFNNRLNHTPQDCYFKLYNTGKGFISDEEMYRTFNCGVGFILSVRAGDVENVLRNLPKAAVVGNVIHGNGRVKILSAFSDTEVEL